jgi:hypothetical protein
MFYTQNVSDSNLGRKSFTLGDTSRADVGNHFYSGLGRAVFK